MSGGEEVARVLRDAVAAWERPDDPDAWVAPLDENVEWHTAPDEPDAGVRRGRADVAAMLAGWHESFDGFRIEVVDLRRLGDGALLVRLAFTGRMRGSDAELRIEETHIHRLRGGRIAEVRSYRTTEQALEALAEEGPERGT